jgi:hypothetical protein
MIFASDIAVGVLGGVAVSCAFPRGWAPWRDLDLVCKTLLRRFLGLAGLSLSEQAWRESYPDRASLLKYAVWGSVLVLFLPLHTLASSTRLVDILWEIIERTRHYIAGSSDRGGVFAHVHNWRDAPYELWEVCIFLWVFPIIGNWIKRDYLELAIRVGAEPGRNFRAGQLLSASIFVLSVMGAFFLVVLDAPRFRLLIELLVVVILAGADLYFCRKWLFVDYGRAIGHLEVFLIVDAGAVIGFVTLLTFFETNLSYGLHWTNAFVAGASAFNLVVANTASLVFRGVQGYRESRPKDQTRPQQAVAGDPGLRTYA